ncbi:acyl-CoA N-acyltransferase [Daedaleopsis nitida]|nr:acyl-CoA N-acyltransferase [Daedaleopsis nitida]
MIQRQETEILSDMAPEHSFTDSQLSAMDSAGHRLQSTQLASNGRWKRVLVLPDDARVDIEEPQDASRPTKLAIEATVVCAYRTLPRSKFPLLEILPAAAVEQNASTDITVADLWGALNVLHTLFHKQENIPIVFSRGVKNAPDLTSYLLISGLARRRHTLVGDTSSTREPELFLLRETFWQGAGTTTFHNRGWLRGHAAKLASAPFPYVQSFTRSPLVIAGHPLRPPKPRPGDVVYRKYVPSMGRMLEFTYLDLGADGDDEVSPHLATFHRWHNSDHVNRGWGERGPIEKHRQYIRDIMADPGVLPVMMSWDGELMGYAELVYIKENHVAPYVPGGAWDYDRGLHILVGEPKFRGLVRSKPWIAGIHHFLFMTDARTLRVIGEPKAKNYAVILLSETVGMNLETSLDLPYKRSVMTWLPRERFFKLDVLAFAQGEDGPSHVPLAKANL